MKIALIIVSICLALAGLFCFILVRILKRILDNILIEQEMEEEILFTEGAIDIPDDRIQQKFLNAILLCHLEPSPPGNTIWKVVDTSNYQKNHIIGLTYFVQPEFLEELKSALNKDSIREKIKERILEEIEADDDMDEDFLDELIDDAMGELTGEGYQEDEYGTMTRPLLPHCTVYQLKDGRWLWRQESY